MKGKKMEMGWKGDEHKEENNKKNVEMKIKTKKSWNVWKIKGNYDEEGR
jgi:hypothetical protein